MGDLTGVHGSGFDKTQLNMPTFEKGTLGHFTVAIGTGAEPKAAEASTSKIVLYSEKISLWDRIVNWFTGVLDKEKNMTLVGFIGTGNARVFDFKTESISGEGMGPIAIEDRISVFEKLMLGKTGAGVDEKKAACKAFENVIASAWDASGGIDEGLQENIRGVLSRVLDQAKDDSLRLDIIGLQDYLENGIPPGAEIENLVGDNPDDGDVVVDYLEAGPFVIEDDELGEFYYDDYGMLMEPVSLDSESKVNDSVDVSGPPKAPMPIESALATLEGKIGAHTLISDMKKLLEAGTQPVVLLEKLEKLYDSPSVKYDDGKKQAVREAAKEIYDKAMHGDVVNSMMYHDQLRVVDALVGLEFKGVHAMRLGEAESPLEL